MSWLDVDGAPTDAPDAVELKPDGVHHRVGGRLTVVPWDRVLGVERVDWRDRPTLYVLAPRRPPRPPWIDIIAALLPPDVDDLAALERTIEGRAAQRGFRTAAPPRASMTLEELRGAVMANREIAGAVEVPVGPGPSGAQPRRLPPFAMVWAPPLVAIGMLVAVVVLSGGYVFVPIVHAEELGYALVIGCVVAAYALVGAGVWTQRRRRSALRRRVLVLAPDGFVIGVRGGVLAHRWSEAELVPWRDASGRLSLNVTRGPGRRVASVRAEWFDAPLPLVVAIATAYRERIAR